MFFDTVVLQAISRRFHRHVDDALLDRCAWECGCSPIGRMCLLDDGAALAIAERCRIDGSTRVVDLGCGRGFFGRWLIFNGIPAHYTGVDRDPYAVTAARRLVPDATIIQDDFRVAFAERRFDVVTAIEVAIGGAIDPALLNAAAAAAAPGARVVLTVASLEGSGGDRLAQAEVEATHRFAEVTVEDWTLRAMPFARRTFEWWLKASWPSEIEEKCAFEARAVLDAIERQRFAYAVLFARAHAG